MTSVLARPTQRRVEERTRAVLVTAVAGLLLVVSIVWGWRVQADPNTKLGAAPLVGEWRVRFGWSLVGAAAIGVVVVAYGPRLAARWPFRRVVACGALVAAAFALALAASDGWAHVLDPVVHPTEYWANLATLPPAGEMLRRYDTVAFLLDYSVHAKGHPPGFLLVLKALASVGLGAPWVASALSYAGIAGVVAAVASTVRIVVGEAAARATLPFLVVAPYAVWMGTSADALYACVAACGVLAVAAAMRRTERWSRVSHAALGGAVLGGALFLTYGAAVFVLVTAAVLLAGGWRDRRSLLAVIGAASAGAAAVTAAFAFAGFWWFSGAATTRTFYWWGTAQFRPAGYFLVANLGAAIVASGPAVVVALGLRRPRAAWIVVGAALACIAAADLSQYSKAEVERIWLLFFPWLVPAVAALTQRRVWLALQVACAVGLQVALVSKW